MTVRIPLVFFLLASSVYSQPAGVWEGRGDIGVTPLPGSVQVDAATNEYRLTGGGANIWGTQDAMFFAWKRISGDFTLTADIRFVGAGVDPHRKAVLMLRQDLTPGSAYADAALHGDGLTSLQYRPTANGPTLEKRSAVTAPVRLRLVRQGNRFTLYAAKAGEDLAASDPVTVDIQGPAYLGLGVSSHNAQVLETAIFSNVRLDQPQAQTAARPRYRSKVMIYDVAKRTTRQVYQHDDVVEAPNWSRDGKFLLINTAGNLYRLPLDVTPPALQQINLSDGGPYRCNNDHDLSRDGRRLAFSASTPASRQSQVFVANADGTGVQLRTPAAPSYFHGWSPDGKWLAFVGQRNGKYELFRVSAEGGAEERLTSKGAYDDGPEYSPDGKWIYFNSDRSGAWDIWRIPSSGGGDNDSNAQRVTSDEGEDWFPHISPNGKQMVFLSFPKGTKGHNDRMEGVMLRMMPAPGKSIKPAKIVTFATFYGGQGTINVNSWSPDSRQFSYVVYEPLTPTAAIKVDQVGYLPNATKVAMVADPAATGAFHLIRATDGAVVHTGTLSAPLDEPDSGDKVRAADFSALTAPGAYYLTAAGSGRSWPFEIGAGIYSRPWYLAMRSYYGQRCGTAVDLGPEFPGYRYEACHTEGAWHASSGKSGTHVSTRGWHDAGDYGRYIVNSGITTGTLLWTWELFGNRLKTIKLNLPESGNGTPDVLNEIRWNLDWMFTMQDTDGGVFHKQTSERFCGFVMPDKDKLPSVVIGSGKDPFKTTCSTADFAAVMAIAARVYKPFDAAYSARALKAATEAWTWAAAHPNLLYSNPTGVSTGAYGDRNCSDELLWAAAELYRTTKGGEYQTYFNAHWSDQRKTLSATSPPSWATVGPMALWTWALAHPKDAQDPAALAIRQDSIAAATTIAQRTSAHAYRTSLTRTDYIWGSNAVAANYGLQLLVANLLSPNPAYLTAANDNLHYLLGRNTLSVSWLTQVGANAFRNPHHRPSGADQNPLPWPGLLSGGPNGRKQDSAMRRMPDLAPARMFADEQESYASNEIAINWNAPLVFLLAGSLPAH